VEANPWRAMQKVLVAPQLHTCRSLLQGGLHCGKRGYLLKHAEAGWVGDPRVGWGSR
jgi:hypothetical protein